jgi:serine protease Do
MRTRLPLLAALAAAVLFVASPLVAQALGRGEAAQATPPATTGSSQPTIAAPQSMQDVQLSFRDVAKKVLPVVVEIDVTEKPQQGQSSPFDFFFNFGNPNNRNPQPQRPPVRQGLGSGIIIQQSGDTVYVLTNYHVVNNANTIQVKLDNQQTYEAKVVGTDTRRDLALVSFTDRNRIPVATLGNSDNLQVGDLVLAVGNPFGFESTVTMGIVSALGRVNPNTSTQTYTNYIQTDAAINEGNSGGALVDVNGNVVGINTWIAAPTGGNIGLGFAIPINTARSVLPDLMKGQVQYGWLGVQIGDLPNTDVYSGFASDLKVNGVAGAAVANIYKGSPADKAGILPLRYGERMKLNVTLGARDPNDTVAQPQNLWPGMTVLDITPAARQQVEIPAGADGVVVGAIGDGNTPAVIAGFKVGDVITAINGKPVHNMMEYYKALNAQRNVSFTVNRAGTEVTIGVTR